ncbi:hypothetical protein PFISCL1PPCAC_16261, partial [Pristionchus fissidentatus]
MRSGVSWGVARHSDYVPARRQILNIPFPHHLHCDILLSTSFAADLNNVEESFVFSAPYTNVNDISKSQTVLLSFKRSNPFFLVVKCIALLETDVVSVGIGETRDDSLQPRSCEIL